MAASVSAGATQEPSQDLRTVLNRLSGPKTQEASAHTPKPGSREQVAICDALLVYVAKQQAIAALKKKIAFTIGSTTTDGNYAFIDGVPVYAEGIHGSL